MRNYPSLVAVLALCACLIPVSMEQVRARGTAPDPNGRAVSAIQPADRAAHAYDPDASLTPAAYLPFIARGSTMQDNCKQLVQNGGFEGNGGWSMPESGSQARYTDRVAHTGLRSLQLGLLPGSGPAGPQSSGSLGPAPDTRSIVEETRSIATQTILIPEVTRGTVLTFWLSIGSQEIGGGDIASVMLLDAGTDRLLKTLVSLAGDNIGWQPVTTDISEYQGRQIKLKFEVVNDGTGQGGSTWMFVDDVSASACNWGPIFTPSVTVAPSPTQKATLTATSRPSPSPTETSTDTASPTQTATAGSTPAAFTSTPAQTSINSPTATLTPTPTPTPRNCPELVLNGGFEASRNWVLSMPGTNAGYTTAEQHSGTGSLLLGLASTAGSFMDPLGTSTSWQFEETPGQGAVAIRSSAYQAIPVPADAAEVTLSLWYNPGAISPGSGDLQRFLIMSGDGGVVLSELVRLQPPENDQTWKSMTFDLTKYRGQSIAVAFEVSNMSATSAATWMFVDDVSIRACQG